MRRVDDAPLDPEVAASLDAIDVTLAGEPVDPRHAEMAELALLLAAERPRPDARFAGSLDGAVERAFAPAAGASAVRRRSRWWLWSPAAGLAAAVVAAVIVVLVGGGVHQRSSASSLGLPAEKVPSASAGHAAASPTRRPSAQPASPVSPTPAGSHAPSPSGAGGSSTASSSGAAVLQPPPNGRKIIQAAQLALTAAPSQVEAVAQEVFVVVGQAHGIVNGSTVTATGGSGAYAQFQLSIPSSALPQTMASLSSLRYARVASRTDTTQDVNDQYQADVRRLADARAQRTSLLRQLANATTQAQIDSLTARIHDAEASISSDEAALRALGAQIDYSQVTVTINGGPVPVPLPAGSSSGGGFGVGQAAHDAGRVLTVAAGVALIVGAVLGPLALLGALAWWIARAVRRRRREQALDLV